MSKEVNKTYLSIDNAEERGFLHRDYIAHCFRWSHVIKYLQQKQRYQTATILDVGCGMEVPMIKTLYTSKMTPYSYTGVDAGFIEQNDMFAKIHNKMQGRFLLYEQEDFVQWIDFKEHAEHGQYNTIVCFEVLEHVLPKHAIAILQKIHKLLSPEGMAFISTPCYSHKTGAAANHLNEMTYETLGALLEHVIGFHIEAMYGTFASQRDYVPYIKDGVFMQIFDRLSEYYDSNMVSVIMAPLFPGHSRNVLWRLNKNANLANKFAKAPIEKPYSSANQKEWEGVFDV